MTPEQRWFIYKCVERWTEEELPRDTLELPHADCLRLCGASGFDMASALRHAASMDLSPAVMAVVHELLAEEKL